MSRGRARRAAAAAVVLALGLAACPGGNGDGRDVPGPSPGVRAVRGGTLRAVLADDAEVLDPHRAGRPEATFFARAMHRGLMAFPPGEPPASMRPVPDLAEDEPAIGPDALIYTFRLRDDARFGPPASTPVTAQDVRAGIERFLRLDGVGAEAFDVLAGAAEVRAGRRKQASGISTPDERTIVFRLRRRSSDFLWMLALPQAAAMPVGVAARLRLRPADIPPSGPYALGEYVPGERIRLVRNVAWDPESDPVRGGYVDEIDAATGLSQRQIAERLAGGEADLRADSVLAAGPLEPAERRGAEMAATGCLRYLFMNTRVDPFDDARVRRAVLLALDRRAVRAAGGRPGVPPLGVLPPTVFGSAAAPSADAQEMPAEDRPADPAGARKLLREAGLARGFGVLLTTAAEDRAEADAIADALAPAGIRVTVRAVPLAQLYPAYYERPARRIAMGVATWCADWPGLGGRTVIGALLDSRRISATGNTVLSMLDSPGLRALIDAATGSRTEAQAIERWRAADRAASGLAAIVPITWLTELLPAPGRLRGARTHPLLTSGDPANVWLAAE